MRSLILSATAAIALSIVPATAEAQAAAQAQGASAPASASVKVNQTVYGADGNAIGTVAATQADAVLVDTGTAKIPIPAKAFGTGKQGPTLNITKAALEAQFQKAMADQAAKLDAALVVGAKVETADAQELGTVKSVADGNIILDSAASSKPLTMPKEYFALDQHGAPIVRATMAQIQKAVSTASSGG